MSTRDELAGLLFTTDNSKAVSPWSEWEHAKQHPRLSEYVYAMADALLEAGYRKPRIVTTAEELDALRAESVVLSDLGFVYEKYADDDGPGFDYWLMPGEQRAMSVTKIDLPATVLYEGTQS